MRIKNETILSYVAGVIDCDGYISILKHDRDGGYRLRVGVINTNKDLPYLLQKLWAGSVKERVSKNIKWKKRYDWNLYTKKAGKFLEEIKKYLVIKNEQAKIAIEYSKRKHLGERSDEEKKLDYNDYIKMKALNSRGQVTKYTKR